MVNGYYIHDSVYIDEDVRIGQGTAIWHFSHVLKGAQIGENCILGQNIMIDRNVCIGNGVKIQNNVSVYTGVQIENDVFIGPSVVFTNVINPRAFIDRKQEFKNTMIKNGATVGANATIICGITIGEYAMIGAGTVVTQNVPNYALMVGNPAKQIGWMSEHGHRLEFDSTGKATCKESGQVYQLENNSVKRIS